MKKLILLFLILSSSAALAQTETKTQFQVTSDAISAYIQRMKVTSGSAQYSGSDYVEFRKYYDQKVEGALTEYQEAMTLEILPQLGTFMAEKDTWALDAQISFYQEIFENKILSLYGLFPNLVYSKATFKKLDILMYCTEWLLAGKVSGKKVRKIVSECEEGGDLKPKPSINDDIYAIFYNETLKFCKSKRCVSSAMRDYTQYYALLDNQVNKDLNIKVAQRTASLNGLDHKKGGRNGYHLFIEQLEGFKLPPQYNELPFSVD